MKALIAGLAALVVAGAALPAIAQDSSARAIAPHFTPEQAAAFSKQMERDLADRGARVAIVFRAGRTAHSGFIAISRPPTASS